MGVHGFVQSCGQMGIQTWSKKKSCRYRSSDTNNLWYFIKFLTTLCAHWASFSFSRGVLLSWVDMLLEYKIDLLEPSFSSGLFFYIFLSFFFLVLTHFSVFAILRLSKQAGAIKMECKAKFSIETNFWNWTSY